MRKVSRVKVVRNAAWGEWIVRAWDQHGRRFPDADYFTTDRADAHDTARAMLAGVLA